MARMLSTFLYKAGIQEYWDGNYKVVCVMQARAETSTRKMKMLASVSDTPWRS